ncbi:putative MIF4G-like domain superfamily protein [Helianthus anomalus]
MFGRTPWQRTVEPSYKYAAVFAALVSGLACLVGIDFGAKLLASLAKCFEDEYRKEDNLSLRNLHISLLLFFYNNNFCLLILFASSWMADEIHAK